MLDIVDLDLKKCNHYCWVHFHQQNVGAPIDGVLSTVYAILTCAFAEHNWVCSIGTDIHFLSSVRYIDDGTVAIAFSKDRPLSLIRAHYLRNSLLTSCYPDSLELKEESIDHGKFRFLETLTTFSGSALQVEHFQKNSEFI